MEGVRERGLQLKTCFPPGRLATRLVTPLSIPNSTYLPQRHLVPHTPPGLLPHKARRQTLGPPKTGKIILCRLLIAQSRRETPLVEICLSLKSWSRLNALCHFIVHTSASTARNAKLRKGSNDVQVTPRNSFIGTERHCYLKVLPSAHPAPASAFILISYS